jgi:hypothetical protein
MAGLAAPSHVASTDAVFSNTRQRDRAKSCNGAPQAVVEEGVHPRYLRPAAGESIEFFNTAALVHRHMGKIQKCCRIIDAR